jgi:uncharacterized protein
MAKKIFINLPISDLKKSKSFYSAIGFTNNSQFSDETAACMIISDEIYVMILTHAKFREFIKKDIADTHKTTSVINSLSLDSIEEVNSFMDKVLKAGGKEPSEAKDYGWMLQRNFEDPDGNHWEVFYMDESKFPA